MMRKVIGHYYPQIQKKGFNESYAGAKEGHVFWTVYMGEGASFDTKRQEDAIIISELVQIKQLLKKRK